MNGIHDLGGMTCFGPVVAEADEPVFHSDWERRVFAINVASGSALGSIDYRRHGIERIAPEEYLRSSYYEKWLARVEMLAVETGLIDAVELASGKLSAPGAGQPRSPEEIDTILRAGRPASRDSGRQLPRFAIGDRVRARNLNPFGHTRLPRYVRGRLGTVRRVHGTHVFPDTNAHDLGENPQPLYSVAFASTELWGPGANGRDHLYIDLWEDYLEDPEDKAHG